MKNIALHILDPASSSPLFAAAPLSAHPPSPPSRRTLDPFTAGTLPAPPSSPAAYSPPRSAAPCPASPLRGSITSPALCNLPSVCRGRRLLPLSLAARAARRQISLRPLLCGPYCARSAFRQWALTNRITDSQPERPLKCWIQYRMENCALLRVSW